MARPIKKGIDYFPLDVDFLQDLKVRKVRRSCGGQAPLILLCVLAHVYQDEGYYLAWDEDVCFMIAEDTGVSEELVSRTVERAAAVGFFAQQLWQEQHVLTSHGIQARYAKAAYQKLDHSLRADLVLLPGNVTAKAAREVDPGENQVNQVVNPQSKEIAKQMTKEHQQSINREPENVVAFASQTGTDNTTTERRPDQRHHDRPSATSSVSSPIAQALAAELLLAIRQHLPRLRQPDLNAWAPVFQKMVTEEQRSISEIKQMIAWSQQDSFWQGVVLDAAKFRQHFDQMSAQQHRTARPQTAPIKDQGIIPSWLREQEAQEALEKQSEPMRNDDRWTARQGL